MPFSTFLFGADQTQVWSFAGLSSTQVVGLLAVGWMVVVTLVASKGINKIARITAVGGISVMCLNLVLLLVSIAIPGLNGGHFAQEVNFVASPNPHYQSGLAMLSFVVFAIFAYGGIEAVGGLVDKTENPEKNLAKGLFLQPIVISIGYSLAIFLWGVSTNWQQVSAITPPISAISPKVLDEKFRRDAGASDAPDSRSRCGDGGGLRALPACRCSCLHWGLLSR